MISKYILHQRMIYFRSIWTLSKCVPSKDVTPYMHALHCHVPEFLSLYLNIAHYTQQGLKKYNDIASKDYFGSTNHKGIDAPKQRHRTKSHVSVFLKRGGNMQFHVSVIFTSRGNVKTQVLRDSVTFPERKLASHVSAMFKLADFRYCAFPSCFCKRIYSCLLHLPKHKLSRWFLEQQ